MDEQRASILNSAETLFLHIGLENTSMTDIARQTGINKVTLYRYFPNRDVIALEIQARMIQKIGALVEPVDPDLSLDSAKKMVQAMIRNFALLSDAYRYIGMFDKLYLDHPPDAAITRWTKDQLIAFPWFTTASQEITKQHPQVNRFIMIMSTVIWFLEKLALRGELTWSDQEVPLEEHLRLFEEMIMGYIDRFTGAQ